MTTETVHVDIVTHMPLDGGGYLPIQQTISAHPTSTPGLVVFPEVTFFAGLPAVIDGAWHVTHALSGMRIPVTFPSQETATAYANDLGALADWSAEWKHAKSAISPADVLRIAREHDAVIDARYAEVGL